MKDPGAFDDPQRLLQMQMEVYKLAHNVEILSRTVSEAASGIKTILQTQV
jgi:type III secretion system YscI/HrpB-like protein